jgi:hypothetical protein
VTNEQRRLSASQPKDDGKCTLKTRPLHDIGRNSAAAGFVVQIGAVANGSVHYFDFSPPPPFF